MKYENIAKSFRMLIGGSALPNPLIHITRVNKHQTTFVQITVSLSFSLALFFVWVRKFIQHIRTQYRDFVYKSNAHIVANKEWSHVQYSNRQDNIKTKVQIPFFSYRKYKWRHVNLNFFVFRFELQASSLILQSYVNVYNFLPSLQIHEHNENSDDGYLEKSVMRRKLSSKDT